MSNFQESTVTQRKCEKNFSCQKDPFNEPFLQNDTQKFHRGLILTKTGKVQKAAKPSSKAEVNYGN